MTYLLAIPFPFLGLLFAGRFFYAIIFFIMQFFVLFLIWPMHLILILCAWVLIDSKKIKKKNKELELRLEELKDKLIGRLGS